MDDVQLVGAIRGGDRQAFAQLYDRYAPAIHAFCSRMLNEPHTAADATQDTFVVAAQRLDQLRDPTRLRAWLYAIARNECTRHGRARGRVVPVAEPEVVSPVDADEPAAAASSAEVARLLWTAADGLDDRDRLLLELNVRHGLEGKELADAAGLPSGQISMATGRMRERIERSLGALLVARKGRSDCPGLQAVLADWDGTYSVLVRKRVARHVDGCDVCERRRASLVAPLGSLAALPFALPDADIRERVLGLVDHLVGDPTADADSDADTDSGSSSDVSASAVAAAAALPALHETWRLDGFPPVPEAGPRSRPAWLVPVAAVGILLLFAIGVLAIAVRGDGKDQRVETGPAPAPSPIHTPSTTTDRSTTTAPGRTTSTTKPTGSATTTSTPGVTDPTAPTATTVAGGPTDTAPPPTVAIPGGGPSGPGSGSGSGGSGGTGGTDSPSGTTAPPPVDTPPVVGPPTRNQVGPLRTSSCTEQPKSTGITVSAVDDRGVVSVVLRWSQAGGGSGQLNMGHVGSSSIWQTTLGPFASGGDVTYSAVARDTRGATVTTSSATVGVDPCPG